MLVLRSWAWFGLGVGARLVVARAFSPLLFAPPAFPLAGVVAFAGSRHGSPFAPAPVVAAVLGAGGTVRVGCACGVDQAVRAAAVGAPAGALCVLHAVDFGRGAGALVARTRAVVGHPSVEALCLFPPASGLLGPGSSLALSVALERGVPVWCAGARPEGRGWSSLALAGVPGFVCLSSLVQVSLF